MVGHGDKPKSETSPEVRDEVIERLYEVAMDPTRYEDLLDRWESMIQPLREGANGTLINVDVDAEYASHFIRADKFLEKLDDNSELVNHLAHVDKSAAFLIGRDLHFIDVNAAAKAVLHVKTGDKLSDLPIEAADLRKLERQTAAMLIGNEDTSVVLRTRLLDSQRLVIFQLQTLRQEDEPPLVVAISSEVSWPTGFDALLKSAFTLTEAEIGVVHALTECLSLREIAKARDRSIDTVRAQLKSALNKTETRSQTELVRLALSMMDITKFTEDISTSAPPHSTGTEYLVSRPFHQITLRDGRKMEYLVLGCQTGKPMVFLPQDYGLVRWPASAEAEAERRGIKIIVPIRPGYGNSTPLPKKQPPDEIIAHDLNELLEHLKIDRFPFLTLGADIYYALDFHRLYPDRVSAVIVTGGYFPLETSEQYERMAKWHRFILASARYTPHLLPFMVKAGFLLARRLGKRKFVHAVFGTSPADVATFENPEVYEAMVCGSEVSLSKTHSAHDAFSSEVLLQERTDWAHLIEGARDTVPLFCLNGLQDPQVPPDTLREVQAKHPWVEFTEYEDCGQLVFFKKWREIIPLVEKYL